MSGKATPASIASVAAQPESPRRTAMLRSIPTSPVISTLLKALPAATVGDAYSNHRHANWSAWTYRSRLSSAHPMASPSWRTTPGRRQSTMAEEPSAPATISPPSMRATESSIRSIRVERTVSTSNQPQHVVLTGVYDLLPSVRGTAGAEMPALARAAEQLQVLQHHSDVLRVAFGSYSLFLRNQRCQSGTCLPSLAIRLLPGSSCKDQWRLGTRRKYHHPEDHVVYQLCRLSYNAFHGSRASLQQRSSHGSL